MLLKISVVITRQLALGLMVTSPAGAENGTVRQGGTAQCVKANRAQVGVLSLVHGCPPLQRHSSLPCPTLNHHSSQAWAAAPRSLSATSASALALTRHEPHVRKLLRKFPVLLVAECLEGRGVDHTLPVPARQIHRAPLPPCPPSSACTHAAPMLYVSAVLYLPLDKHHTQPLLRLTAVLSSCFGRGGEMPPTPSCCSHSAAAPPPTPSRLAHTMRFHLLDHAHHHHTNPDTCKNTFRT